MLVGRRNAKRGLGGVWGASIALLHTHLYRGGLFDVVVVVVVGGGGGGVPVPGG